MSFSQGICLVSVSISILRGDPEIHDSLYEHKLSHPSLKYYFPFPQIHIVLLL